MPNQVDIGRYTNQWTEVERSLYNQLPIYLAQTSVEYNKQFDRWNKVLKPYKWSANQGNLMKGVRKERSPILRGQFLPNPITSQPKRDVIEVKELTEQVQLYRHDFDSQTFHFLSSFQDFLTDHVDYTNKDMAEKIMVAKDLFYRTAIFHGSPYVWVCGKQANTELTAVPYWNGATISQAKDTANLQALVGTCTQGLTLNNIKKLGTVMYNDINVDYYNGDTLPEGSDGAGIKGKYCLIHGSEVWDGFTDGGYLLENKALDLDIVTGPFQGSLFGRWTCLLERFELRITADGRIVAPETLVVGDTNTVYNVGETVMNPDYVNAPFGVAFACGNEAYKAITVGAPPNMFKDNSGLTMDKFNGMDWNGKIHITRDLLIPTSQDANGVVTNWDTNKRGEYLQLISDVVMGILPIRRRNIVPIIYLRTRGVV